jgi:hypothetical protein
MIYYLILLMLFVFSVVEIFAEQFAKIILIVVSFVFFVVFVGLKLDVGTDYYQYTYLYKLASVYTYKEAFGVEYIYWGWMKMFIWLGVHFYLFWFITCLFNLLAKFYLFNKLTPYFFPCLLVYFVGLFFERDFDGIRQGIAIGVCYFALKPLVEKKFIAFLAIIIIASLIHGTSLVFLLLPLINYINLSLKAIAIILGLCLLLVMLKIDISDVIFSNLPNSFAKGKIDTYLAVKDELYIKSTGISIGILFRISILILFIYYGKIYYANNPFFNTLKNGFFIAIVFSLLFNSIDIVGHRLAYGLREFQLFIIPSFLLITTNKWKKLIVLGGIFVYSFFLLYRLLNTEHLKPYYEYHNLIFELLK